MNWILETVTGEVININPKEPDRIQVDPLGSYTGIPVDPEEKPIQDADDL